MKKLSSFLVALALGISGISCSGTNDPMGAEDSNNLTTENIETLLSMENLDDVVVQLGSGGTFADNGLRICKGFFGEETVCMFTEVEWRVVIVLRALDANGVTDIEVKDIFPAEYSINNVLTNMGTFTVEPTGGGNSATEVKWNIDALPYGAAARLVVILSTELNPAGIQEFTSPGTYDLNPGVNVHWTWDGGNYEWEGLDFQVEAIECNGN